jgi:hypothetical protein
MLSYPILSNVALPQRRCSSPIHKTRRLGTAIAKSKQNVPHAATTHTVSLPFHSTMLTSRPSRPLNPSQKNCLTTRHLTSPINSPVCRRKSVPDTAANALSSVRVFPKLIGLARQTSPPARADAYARATAATCHFPTFAASHSDRSCGSVDGEIYVSCAQRVPRFVGEQPSHPSPWQVNTSNVAGSWYLRNTLGWLRRRPLCV